MTRKDFQLIANTVKTSMAFVTDTQRQCFALDIANGLKETNPPSRKTLRRTRAP